MISLWDTHMHTSFSGDSQTPPEDQINSAISKKLAGICFTDHMDLDFPPVPEEPGLARDFFLFDTKEYFETLRPLASKYRDALTILTGIELGLQTQVAEDNLRLLKENDFDYVIGSVHVLDHCDPYYDSYWEGFNNPQKAIHHYFEAVLENLESFHSFDSLGHLDYIVRYSIGRGYTYDWADFKDILEAILCFIIDKNIALEINTGAFRAGMDHPNPDEGILSFYRSLGGELITIGADAHRPAHVGLAFDKIPVILSGAGFKGYHVFKKRVPEFVPVAFL